MKGALSAVIITMLFCACDRADHLIKVYRVAKAPLETMPPPDAAMPTNASSPPPLPTVTSTAAPSERF